MMKVGCPETRSIVHRCSFQPITRLTTHNNELDGMDWISVAVKITFVVDAGVPNFDTSIQMLQNHPFPLGTQKICVLRKLFLCLHWRNSNRIVSHHKAPWESVLRPTTGRMSRKQRNFTMCNASSSSSSSSSCSASLFQGQDWVMFEILGEW